MVRCKRYRGRQCVFDGIRIIFGFTRGPINNFLFFAVTIQGSVTKVTERKGQEGKGKEKEKEKRSAATSFFLLQIILPHF